MTAPVAVAGLAPESLAHAEDERLARAVAVNAAAQLLAKVVHLGLKIAASLALIRYLGPAGYGDYIFVLSFSTLVGLLSDFGITKVAVRDMARDTAASPAILGTSLTARVVLSVLSLLLAQVGLLLLGARAELRVAAAVMSLVFVGDALLSVSAVFQVRLAMQYDALVNVAAGAVDTGLTLWLVTHQGSLLQIVAAPGLSWAVGAALAAAIARGRFHARLSLDLKRLPGLMKDALPVGLTLMLAVIYLKVDSVLLGILASPEDVGLYGAAYRPVEYLLIAAAVMIQPAFTLLARWQGVDQARFRLVHRRATQALLACVLPIPVMLAFIAGPLVQALYAPEFAPAAAPLRILGLALVFMIGTTWQDFTLLSGNRQHVTVVYDTIGLAVHVLLILALIPRLGYLGAALSALATSFFITSCASISAARLLGATLHLGSLGRVVLANGGLAASLGLLLQAGLPWLAAAALAGLSYPVWLLVCRVTSLDEVRRLLSARAPAAGRAQLVEVG